MKMKLGITWCYLLFMLINHKNSYYVSAKSVETQNLASCQEHVGEFFKSFLNITIEPSEKVGKCKNNNFSLFLLLWFMKTAQYKTVCYVQHGLLSAIKNNKKNCILVPCYCVYETIALQSIIKKFTYLFVRC